MLLFSIPLALDLKQFSYSHPPVDETIPKGEYTVTIKSNIKQRSTSVRQRPVRRNI
jgi:hypothetical protein